MSERYTWRPLDTIKSIRDIGRTAVSELFSRLDTRYADALNEPELRDITWPVEAPVQSEADL